MKAADAQFLAASPYLMQVLAEAETKALEAHAAEEAAHSAYVAQMAEVLG